MTPICKKLNVVPLYVRWGSSCCGGDNYDPDNDKENISLSPTRKKFKPLSAYSKVEEENFHPDITKILEANKEWVKDKSQSDPDFYRKIGGKQVPKYLYIGCSDSRVPANRILGLDPGEVFVHRNVGNLVQGSDLNVLSVIEFAVNVLDVKHIIVTGHYDCGAVAASTKRQDMGLLENWIRNIRDTHRMHKAIIEDFPTEEEKLRALVELSAIEQCYTVFKVGAVQKKRKETALASGGKNVYPKVTAMVFDNNTGLLKKLPIDFDKSIEGYRHIYDLY
jgi:carbonic anhydrase